MASNAILSIISENPKNDNGSGNPIKLWQWKYYTYSFSYTVHSVQKVTKGSIHLNCNSELGTMGFTDLWLPEK